ncbi:DNA adenine methylase [Ursidibacter arcticus]|uniref:DNA adenine methylase n=1 Tax=Ursidibacter arcticus TaxID=1524965 RepID=UPI001F07D22D|nr:DNA adenine methylase [Ursidibacter arcticus]
MRYTPLRYPGGKSKFTPTIKAIIEKNNLNGHYVEPYAGGAGVALDLLFSGYCTDIHINDLDLAIYYFWKSITEQPEDFIRLINNTEVTIEEWHKQKSILKEKENISPSLHNKIKSVIFQLVITFLVGTPRWRPNEKRLCQ